MFFCDIILCSVSSALAFWLIHQLPVWHLLNSSLVGGGTKYPGWNIWREGQRENARLWLARWIELQMLWFVILSFSSRFFRVSFPFRLGGFGGFYRSFLFFYPSFLHFFPFGWWYLSYCQAGGSEHVFVCIRVSGDKWHRVFMPWFWSALVEEVDAWVRVVWPRSPYWTPSLINMQHSGRFVWTWLDCFNWIEYNPLAHFNSIFVRTLLGLRPLP